MTDFANIYMASSMCLFALPAYVAWQKGDIVLVGLIVVSALASALYHLNESGTHGMRGFSGSSFTTPRWNTVLINLDRAAALALFGYKAWHMQHMSDVMLGLAAFCGLVALAVLAISEMSDHHAYIFIHVLWHSLAALLLLAF